MALTKALREERDSLAQREGDLRWAWGDWAVKVAGPPGESTVNDGSLGTLTAARTEGDSHGDLPMLVPEVSSLLDYRVAAAAIPPKLRKTVRSIEAGKILGRRVKDVRDRHKLIQALTNDNGIVTVTAVRDHFDLRPKNELVTDHLHPRSVQDRADEASRLLHDPKVAQQAVEAALRVPSDAGRAIEKAVEKVKREKAERGAKARQERDEQKALPFPAAMARMIVKIGDWAGDLAYWYAELDTLPPGAQRDQLSKTVRQLEHQAHRWADRLEEIILSELDTDAPIDGTAVEIVDDDR